MGARNSAGRGQNFRLALSRFQTKTIHTNPRQARASSVSPSFGHCDDEKEVDRRDQASQEPERALSGVELEGAAVVPAEKRPDGPQEQGESQHCDRPEHGPDLLEAERLAVRPPELIHAETPVGGHCTRSRP